MLGVGVDPELAVPHLDDVAGEDVANVLLGRRLVAPAEGDGLDLLAVLPEHGVLLCSVRALGSATHSRA